MNKEQKELLGLMTKGWCRMIEENPAMIKAMAMGYKIKFWFDLPIKLTTDLKEGNGIRIKCSVQKGRQEAMTLEEFFEANQ